MGTNDTTSKSMITVINELLQLKHYIVKGGKDVIISCPILRTDNISAYMTTKKPRGSIMQLKVLYLLNRNIDETCLGEKEVSLE